MNNNNTNNNNNNNSSNNKGIKTSISTVWFFSWLLLTSTLHSIIKDKKTKLIREIYCSSKLKTFLQLAENCSIVTLS